MPEVVVLAPGRRPRDKVEGQWGPLDDDEWVEAKMTHRLMAIYVRVRLIQSKYLHQFYYSPDRLWRMGCTPVPECLRVLCVSISARLAKRSPNKLVIAMELCNCLQFISTTNRRHKQDSWRAREGMDRTTFGTAGDQNSREGTVYRPEWIHGTRCKGAPFPDDDQQSQQHIAKEQQGTMQCKSGKLPQKQMTKDHAGQVRETTPEIDNRGPGKEVTTVDNQYQEDNSRPTQEDKPSPLIFLMIRQAEL
ncbi:hypothetical protein NDU88_001841 [Pleurodeles waltl]|uniref:Uncharacterized protein n=1 Tax=Pleurodeles waltl TaxID=8319 RepID=A0AAV7TLF9_PLEWA|nr:hypothetical protein NDU88_001841 [Pleurodeles waltl]